MTERNHKITITRTVAEIDSEGIERHVTFIVHEKWASVEHRNPSEKWSNGRMNPEVTDIFTTGYVPGITSEMGITYGAKRYEIVGVEDIRDEHRELLIQAKEVT